MSDVGPRLRPLVSRREWATVAALSVAFFAVLLCWAMITPIFQAADELQHVDAVMHLALGYSWSDPGTMHLLAATAAAFQDPQQVSGLTWHQLLEQFPGRLQTFTAVPGVSAVNQMSQHPPTSYFIGAGVLRLVAFENLRWDHAVLTLRLLSVILTLPLPLLAWATVRRVTTSPRAAVVGAIAILAIPQIAVIGSSVTNDAPVFLLSGAVTLVVVRVLTGDSRLLMIVLLAVLLGALLWMKGTALPVVPFVAIAVFVGVYHFQGLRRALLRTGLAAIISAGTGAWWWIHNLLLYGTLQPEGFVSREPKPFPAGQGPDIPTYVATLWNRLSETFWGSPGRTAQFPMSQILIDVGTVLAIGVIVVFAIRRHQNLMPALVLAVLPATFVLIETTKAWLGYQEMGVVGGTQGRYYFPALIALITLSAIAWRRLPRTGTGRAALATALSVIFGLIALYGISFDYRTFWENRALAVTSNGLAIFFRDSNAPGAVVLLCAALAIAGLTVVVLLSRKLPQGADR
ncbi:glycosyltransferase family 39 protein [Curtobacterium sp. SL109]|uniref:glycosyltransferase family 39 protein n=1 Tax=Curtobacterium sp. SL109 TaxID=2994662 RepID=UPI0022753110|nr:glycosyltransferase family 39 protein [Curtobacterium sp. SL109]MCY1692886.1 glycosyltransferase family 39 protein [Curtobacterium sp. SL109]